MSLLRDELTSASQSPRRIPKIQHPIRDSNNPVVWIEDPDPPRGLDSHDPEPTALTTAHATKHEGCQSVGSGGLFLFLGPGTATRVLEGNGSARTARDSSFTSIRNPQT